MTGQTISHYRILDKLGEGGMGVVYKAEDLNLHRTVALKFLRTDTLGDQHLYGRFWKEAEAAAALDHPNIPTVHEISEVDGQTFIAMAFIEGESLAEKIKQRPLPLDEALGIAIQIGEALQVAHERGIVHRDIKPANVMITPNGRVKVMDFGLAHLAGQTRITKTGTVMGTPAYMSPEQAQGDALDRRSDIWSLGTVIYEMVTGQLPFRGDTDHAVLRAILDDQPEPMTAIRVGTPPELDRIVGKALEKEPGRRYQDADDITVDLRSLAERLATSESPTAKAPLQRGGDIRSSKAGSSPLPQPGWPRRVWFAWTLVAGLALALMASLYFRTTPKLERPVRKWSFAPESLATGLRTVAISPNGKHLAYLAGPGERTIWVRDIDRVEPRRLAGTEGAKHGFSWSPDSEWIAFGTQAETKKVSCDGGQPITLCQLPTAGAGSWSSDGKSIAFSSGGKIYEVPSSGGKPKIFFEPVETGKGRGNYYPTFLPSQAHASSVVMGAGAGADTIDLVLKNLETDKWQVLVDGFLPSYSPSGHILFRRKAGSETSLWALPFALDTLQPEGEPFPIAESADSPSVAQDGTLVFVSMPDVGLEQLVWRDRKGTRVGEIGQPQYQIRNPVLSPDGRLVAVDAEEDIWLHEVERPEHRRLTFHTAADTRPQWSPTGQEITFLSAREGSNRLYRKAADGTGETELQLDKAITPHGWSRDGNYLLYMDGQDLWYLQRGDDGNDFRTVPFLETPFWEYNPSLSPDGRFIAYCSDQSGETQVLVRPFPSGEGQWQVSTAGGCHPRWSHTGKELFYVHEDTLVAAKVETSPVFSIASTNPLFTAPNLARGRYAVAADGRFVLVESMGVEGAKPPVVHVVENWYEEFRDRQ